MIKSVNHIGIIGKEFEPTIERLKTFGLVCTEVIEAEEVGGKMAFFPVGETVIEYMSFADPEKAEDPLMKLVLSQNGAINHICFEVDNLEETIHDFEENGARLAQGCPRSGLHGRIAFFYPETTQGILIELQEA
jgi:methylmalonyl-CoA/ethylmalonyl-CoA epimerase